MNMTDDLGKVTDSLVSLAVGVDATAALCAAAERRDAAASALVKAASAVRDLRRVLDEVELLEIAAARSCGCSWEQIGSALGVTRQAALMRWSHAVDELERGQLDRMTDPLV